MINTSNKSPLRYPGGKTRACKILDDIIRKYFKFDSYDTIISPFFGGGSFEFYLQNKYNKKIIANDLFTPLYNFWNETKLNSHKLCAYFERHLDISKDDFYRYRKYIMRLDNKPIKQAEYYFIINRCSFSGATLSGGFSKEASKKRFTLSSIDRVKKLDLSHIDFYNHDFEKFINDFCVAKTFMFLDPPYYLQSKSRLYGNSGNLHIDFDHNRLFKTVQNKKNWIMTYNDCDFIRKLYKNFIIKTVDWSYGMNKDKKSSEIVIISI